MKQQFYICEICGNLVGKIQEGNAVMSCCGQAMTLLDANTRDAAVEKHLPVVQQDGQLVSVRVGALDHPMTVEHSIQWIYLLTAHGDQRKRLCADDAPAAVFSCTADDMPLEVYA